MPNLNTSEIFAASRGFASPRNCPYCRNLMVAPEHSEFVEGGEIRHIWCCDACAGVCCTSMDLGAVEH